ncbi:DUF6074 family protein [Prosthecomicrobium pneumaticum]|uniref:Uncharacterized protein n=1 Tax=Prosthecomicrobium pneumaticum TaxID=81895 RepID=A0A7W9L3C1_9HYPH|nr:DUF6074 family protein [Prosthecomicrobium pneumaticum]MBB5754344.1 hypothetical protein [Prosthecomicrobium pneumaticum]
MSAVVPFPRTRDRRFIRRHALRMAESAPSTAEKLLAHQLRIQTDTMRKRGIDERLIEQERRAIEGAIRGELWRVVLTPEGAA